MPTAACQQRIVCECTDDPVSNYSAELPDVITYRSIGYEEPDVPLGVEHYRQLGCKSLCESTVSQEEADLCAQRQATECVIDDLPDDPDAPEPPVCTPPLCGNPVPVASFLNQRQECTVACADGVTFTAVVAAGTIVALSQAIADALAFSLACQRATFPQAICFQSAASLQEGCINTSYSAQIIAAGGVALPYPWVNGSSSLLASCQADPTFFAYGPLVYRWEVISGSLPPGLELRACTGYIDGTPTTAGEFTFTLRATDQAGNFQQKEFHLCIFEITSTSPLPDGEVTTAYSQSLSVNPNPVGETWTVISGSLPPGLTLDSETGIISGTPTTSGTYNFTVQLSGACA